jgi:hypothetical protein
MPSVSVTNLSPSTTSDTLREFFSFCGTIESIEMHERNEGEGGAAATVTFDSDAAASTAVLLNEAIVDEATINVAEVPSVSSEGVAPEASAAPVDEGGAEGSREPPGTATSIIASIVAAGYVLGEEAVVKAKEYDDEHLVSLQVKTGASHATDKVKEVDTRYGISTTASTAAAQAGASLSEVNATYGLTDKVATGVAVASEKVSALGAAAMENPTVAASVTSLWSLASSASARASAALASVSAETKAEIAKREAAKGLSKPQEATQLEDVSASDDASDQPATAPPPAAATAPPAEQFI